MRRGLGILLVVALIGAACGDDDAAPTSAPDATGAATTTVTAAATSTSLAEPPVDVESEARSGSLLLLADDFEDGDADGWDIDDGWYLLGSGSEVRMAASGSAWMWWPGGEDWQVGYVLRASIRVDAGGLAVATAVGPEGRYVVHLHADATDLLIDRPWGTFETLASAAPVAPGEWHALAVGVQGGLLQVYVDGEPLAAAELERPLVAGSVGFGALDGSVVAFDNVYVIVLRAALPALAPSAPVVEPAAEAPEVEEPPEEGEEPSEPVDDGEAGLPNLTAAFVWFAGEHQVAGEAFGLGVEVSNTGTVAAGPFEVVWESGGASCTADIRGLEPGEIGTASCASPALPAGLHAWTAYIDHDERVAESDESDNTISGHLEVAVTSPDLPDLAITLNNAIDQVTGTEYDMYVIVGDLNEVGFEGSYTTRFFLDGQLRCSVDRTGDRLQSRCVFTDLSPGPHLVEVITDAGFDIVESREDNNSLTWEFVVAG